MTPDATPALSSSLSAIPSRDVDQTLVEQLTRQMTHRIERDAMRPGSRLPSIRQLASEMGVSRFTVVEAYDRLVADGHAESRRGAGFFVATKPAAPLAPVPRHPVLAAEGNIDIRWLLRNMFRDTSAAEHAGGGLMPPDWLDAEMVAASVRAVGRTVRDSLLGYGTAQGYAPLRQQLAARLQADGIPAHPDHMLTTSGVTHAFDLIARHLLQAGDTVLVEDPAWPLIFGRLTAFGARPIGVPRGPDGPDLDALARLAALHKPKFFLINAAVHNPTGYSLSAGGAYGILRIAEQHDFIVVEDDTYGELHPGQPIRLAALDQLNRVIHVGGFSKTLAASLRVGYIAAAPAVVQALTDLKILTALPTSELGERTVHRILAEGHYRRHLVRVRARVDMERDRTLKVLLKLGVKVPQLPPAGMFVWGDCGRDTERMARLAAEQGVVLAPGSLFSPGQMPSTRMRFSAATAGNISALRVIESLLQAFD
ncbi:PLP-dependent aminotransferase family protein [Pigmentiphaga aceris]|uniref:PLP-dependent aminotransferase family protein n=1 Tax=Pigmentiphaga aceris TaxID=1940612 RepID=A0A5C0B2E1_9BURK|nr:PLP-dependent aminotransferase family protein [Pigmentiphaga aceris]